MADISIERLKTEFQRQVRLNANLGEHEMLEIVKEHWLEWRERMKTEPGVVCQEEEKGKLSL